MTTRHLFSVFDVTRQVFLETGSSLGIVNLKPLRPGHVLIISKRVVPRLADLELHEVSDLFQTVQRVGRVIEKAYSSEALNIAVQLLPIKHLADLSQQLTLQDGIAAGQSVPHVHVHIIPRLATDFGGVTDKVYPELERNESRLLSDLAHHRARSARETPGENGATSGDGGHTTAEVLAAAAREKRERDGWQVPKDEERKPRTAAEMEKEASWLRTLMDVRG